MNSKQYENPNIDIESFEVADVITTSNGGATELPEDDL